jgi:ADP-heptose:LPS heptosyltransferase
MKQNLGVDPERRIRILIIRLSSIGDIVQCSAVPRHFRARFPNATIDWIIRNDNSELVEHSPYVTRLFSFDRVEGLKGWLNLAKKLKDEHYTHIYDAHNNIRSHILCSILKPKHLIRRSKNRVKRFLLHWLKIDLFGPGFRGVDSFISPLTEWGIVNDLQGPQVFLSPEVFLKASSLLPAKATQSVASAKWLALAPATAWPKKTWPIEHWGELVQVLLAKTSFNLLILGGPNDSFCADLILDSDRMLNLQGKLTLLESAAAVKHCEILIAADTGLLHLSESIGKNVVAILGPTHFGHPYLKTSLSIQRHLWCQPCSKDGSGPCYNPVFQKCMKLIGPEEVFNNIKLLTEPSK